MTGVMGETWAPEDERRSLHAINVAQAIWLNKIRTVKQEPRTTKRVFKMRMQAIRASYSIKKLASNLIGISNHQTTMNRSLSKPPCCWTIGYQFTPTQVMSNERISNNMEWDLGYPRV